MIIETHKVKNSLSRVTRITNIYTGTRWRAKVIRYGLLDKVHWTVYSGQLVIRGGDNYLFSDALRSAIRCLNEKLNSNWLAYA